MKLRNYQLVAVEQVRAAMAKGARAPLLVLATGGGKTICFSYICQSAAAKGKRVLIVAHRAELISQASEKISSLGITHGIIAPKFTKAYHSPVQVASVQTLIGRLDEVPAPDLIIIDEAHHAPAGSWAKVLEAYPRARVLGVTATPVRTDGKGLAGSFDTLIQPEIGGRPVTAKWLMDEGYLCEAVVYAPDKSLDLSGLRKGKSGDYTDKAAAAAVDKPTITGDAVEHYRQYANHQPALAFCASVEHAGHVCEAFQVAGYRAAVLAGNVTDAERKRLIQGLASGQIEVLCSCNMVSEGTDIPVCTAAILMRPTQSLGLHLQQVGRVLRPVYAEGMPTGTAAQRRLAIAQGPKPRAVIIDMVGNVGRWENGVFVERHGFPDAEWVWALGEDKPVRKPKEEGEMEAEKVEAVAQCAYCFAAFKPAPRCPECGTLRDIKARAIVVTEGELREARAAEAQAQQAKESERKEANKNLASASYRAKSKAELAELAQQYGLSKAWLDSTAKRVADWRRSKGMEFYF